jgi:hypothetical protein
MKSRLPAIIFRKIFAGASDTHELGNLGGSLTLQFGRRNPTGGLIPGK